MMTRHERAVILAAKTWWRSHRPVGWRLEKHLRHPLVNTAFRAEDRLAVAVAALEKERGR